MGDFLSIFYTVVDTLSLIFFLDAFATRRWDNWKFKLGVGCFIALLCWVLQVPFVFFGRDPAIKIGMIILAYTISARVLYKEISNSMLLLLVCIEYLVTYYLSFGLGMMGAFICGMDGEAFRSNFPLAMVYGGINYSAELFLTYTFRKVMRQRRLSKKSNNLTSVRSLLYFLFPSTSFVMLVLLLYMTTGKDASEAVVAAACGAIFAANVAVLYLLERMEKTAENQERVLALEQQLQFQAKNMEAASQLYTAQRHKVHDFRAHLNILQGLLQNQEYDAAEQYLMKSVEMVVMSTLAFAISSLVRSTALAIGVSVFTMCIGSTVTQLLGQLGQDWARFLVFANTDLASISKGYSIFAQHSLTFAVGVLIAHMVVFLLTAWDGFTKRSV